MKLFDFSLGSPGLPQKVALDWGETLTKYVGLEFSVMSLFTDILCHIYIK